MKLGLGLSFGLGLGLGFGLGLGLDILPVIVRRGISMPVIDSHKLSSKRLN